MTDYLSREFCKGCYTMSKRKEEYSSKLQSFCKKEDNDDWKKSNDSRILIEQEKTKEFI